MHLQFFLSFSVLHTVGSCVCKRSREFVCNNRSCSLPQGTLLLKRLVSSPAFNYVTSHHITMSHIHSIYV